MYSAVTNSPLCQSYDSVHRFPRSWSEERARYTGLNQYEREICGDRMALGTICFFAALCSLLQQGLAITCYQCNSHNDSRCLLDKLPDTLRLPCTPKDTMCRKISQIVEFEMNGMPPDSRVIRGCGWDESSYKGRCYQRSGFGGRQEVCSCLEDGCNGASLPVAATVLMLLTIALLRFY